jgi:trans-aconitate 2-methyltransferase
MNQEKIKEYYNNYTDRQSSVGVNARHHSILKKSITAGLRSHHNVLEIGCGIGTFTSLIIPYVKTGKIVSLDISPRSIEIAKAKYPARNVTFLAADAVEYDFKDELFDVIVLPDVLEHIPIELHHQLFEKLAKVLKPSGFIFIHIPNPYYLEWCHEHRPDLLQVIDQPITTDILVQNTYSHGLIIEELKSYSIWVVHHDYQYAVLRKNGYQDFKQVIEDKPTLLDKVKYKLNALRK